MGLYLGPFRFTKRGVRVRVGPRAARLHIGAGGAGISTGAGPFTWYQPLRGRKGRRRANSRRPAPPRYLAQPPRPTEQFEATAPHPSGYGRTTQPPPSSGYDPRFGSPPLPPRRNGWEWWTRRRVFVAGSLFAVVILIGVIISAVSPPALTPTPASQHKPAAAASPSPSPSVTSSPAAVIESPSAAATTPAQQAATTQPAPQHTTTQPAPAPAPAGCYPKAPSGNCYEPGQFCPAADAGMTGLAGDGETIVCILESGRYHWHPTS